VIVLDAYPLVALLADEPAAPEVASLIARNGATVVAPNLAEAADLLGRIHGIPVQRTRSAVEALDIPGGLRIRDVDARAAWRAAELRVSHYDSKHCPVSLADCLLLAMTRPEERLATADPHLLAVAEVEAIRWTALPDSRGQVHLPAGRPD
jgi:uncharacterized protein with PIN domain